MIKIEASDIFQAARELGLTPKEYDITINHRRSGDYGRRHAPGCVITCSKWETPRVFETPEAALEALRELLADFTGTST